MGGGKRQGFPRESWQNSECEARSRQSRSRQGRGARRRRPLPGLRGGAGRAAASSRLPRGPDAPERPAGGRARSKKCQGDASEDGGRSPRVRGGPGTGGGSPQAAQGPPRRGEAPTRRPKRPSRGVPRGPARAPRGPYPCVRGAPAREARAADPGRARRRQAGGLESAEAPGTHRPALAVRPSPSSRRGGHERGTTSGAGGGRAELRAELGTAGADAGVR